jgi:hypothetical protein
MNGKTEEQMNTYLIQRVEPVVSTTWGGKAALEVDMFPCKSDGTVPINAHRHTMIIAGDAVTSILEAYMNFLGSSDGEYGQPIIQLDFKVVSN